MNYRIINTLLSYPLSWMALLTIIAIEWAIFDWFDPSMLMQLAALGLGLVLLLVWPILFSRSETLLQLDIQALNQVKPKALEALALLESDLKNLGSTQGLQQLAMLQQKLDSLTEVLNHRLSAGEMTYGRYLGTAEQVYLAAIDNLMDITVALKSVSTINSDYIVKRLEELGNLAETSDETEREVETLEKRLSLLSQQTKRVAELFSQNESAMTALDNTATALADTKTGKGEASMDAEAAMVELEILANRASKYSIAN